MVGGTRARVAQRRQVDEGRAVGEVRPPASCGDGERQAGLADAARAGQRQQPRVAAAQQLGDRGHAPARPISGVSGRGRDQRGDTLPSSGTVARRLGLGQQCSPLGGRQSQRVGQQSDGGEPRTARRVALQLAHRLGADARELG